MPDPWIAKYELKLKVNSGEMVFEAEFTIDGVIIHRTGVADFELSLAELTQHHAMIGEFIHSSEQKWRILKGG